MGDRILRVQVGRILAPYGCGQTRKKSRNRIAITSNVEPCAVKRVKKQGPNTGKTFFCCCNENRCDYFEWGPEELPKQPDAMAPFVPLFYNRYYPDAQQN